MLSAVAAEEHSCGIQVLTRLSLQYEITIITSVGPYVVKTYKYPLLALPFSTTNNEPLTESANSASAYENRARVTTSMYRRPRRVAAHRCTPSKDCNVGVRLNLQLQVKLLVNVSHPNGVSGLALCVRCGTCRAWKTCMLYAVRSPLTVGSPLSSNWTGSTV